MQRKYFMIVLSLALILFLSGCVTPTSSINLTGEWTIEGVTTSGTSPYFIIGQERTDTCSILDDNGALTITNFTSIEQEEIDWEDCTGTFADPSFTIGPLNGSMTYYGDPVTFIINFEGTMNDEGTGGTGTWTATIKIDGETVGTGGGTSVYTKN